MENITYNIPIGGSIIDDKEKFIKTVMEEVAE